MRSNKDEIMGAEVREVVQQLLIMVDHRRVVCDDQGQSLMGS